MIREKPDKMRIVVLVLLMLAFIVLAVVLVRLEPVTSEGIWQLEEHWQVEGPNLQEDDISLADISVPSIKNGESVILRHPLPEEETDSACVQLQTTHASITVSVDGVPVFADGAQYTAAKKMTPSWFHYVPLPDNYGGKELQIEIRAQENSAFSGIMPVMVGNISNLYLYYISTYRITLFISLFLMITGFVMLFVFFFLWNYYKLEIRMLFSTLLALDLGVYLLCYHELPDFLISNIDISDFLEYATLYSIPALAIGFAACTYTGTERKVLAVISAVDFLLLIVQFVLHFTHVIHIDRFVSVCHVIILIECTVLFYIFFKNRRRRKNAHEEQQSWQASDRVLLGSFFIMLAFSLVDIVRFFLRRYFSMVGNRYPDLNFLLTGTMIFVVGLFINFFYYHIERISAEKTTEHLAGLAFTDPLTGMANRSRCDKLLDELNEAGGEYTVVSMDVNYLKRINDTFGHSTGDKYLVDMAAMIRKAFPDAALHGRMGGDEFIVVLPGAVPETYKSCISVLKQEVRDKNASGSEIHYGISYGVAYTYETHEHTLQATYEIADMRMYEMKKIRHAQEDAHAN